MLKKIITAFALGALLLNACVKPDDFNSLKEDFGKIEKKVADLEARCSQMNTDISSLNTIVTALNNSDFVTKVEEVKQGNVVVGYKISFKNSEPITINLVGGVAAPVVGIAEEEGVYYWTLGGEWILDSKGQKMPVSGSTPQLKIEEGFWFISYDGGANWDKLGSAVGSQGTQGPEGPQGPQGPQGPAGDSMFKAITPGNGFIAIELIDGTTIKLPLYVEVTLTLDITGDILAYAGDEVIVNYTISGGSETMLVTVSTDGYYKAKVTASNATSGKITVLCPDPLTPGIVTVNVFDGKSIVTTQLISIKQDPRPITIEGTYSIKEYGTFAYGPLFKSDGEVGANKFPFKDKNWNFDSTLNKENDNKLILTSTGKTPEGYDTGTAEYTAGADGAYWNYTFLAGKTRHTASTCDASAFYSFIPHGESTYIYNRKAATVTLTQGLKTVVVNYFPEGTHTYVATVTDGGTTKTKTINLTVPTMAFDFPLPQEYRELFNQFLLSEGTLQWKDADWFLYYAQSCYMTFKKD